MISFLLRLAAVCMPILAGAQYNELFRISVAATSVSIDNLDNLYTVNNSELKKFTKDGTFQFRFSDKQLGVIGAVDVSYPLRPLLTYPELTYIIQLDNTLSNNRGRINLRDLEINLGTLACASVQNHIWFYDAMSFSLIRASENFEERLRTGNLAQILGIDLQPNYMAEFANRLYLNNPASGILIFDIFGTYVKTIPVKNLESFQVSENELTYFSDSLLTIHNLSFNTDTVMELPIPCRSAVRQKNRVACLADGYIAVFERAKP